MVRGNLTLLQATAVADRWGTRAYGRLTPTLAAPVTTAGALAPWVGSALATGLGGYTNLFWGLAGLSACGSLIAHFANARATPVRDDLAVGQR